MLLLFDILTFLKDCLLFFWTLKFEYKSLNDIIL
jgi:hypothetical protein